MLSTTGMIAVDLNVLRLINWFSATVDCNSGTASLVVVCEIEQARPEENLSECASMRSVAMHLPHWNFFCRMTSCFGGAEIQFQEQLSKSEFLNEKLPKYLSVSLQKDREAEKCRNGARI